MRIICSIIALLSAVSLSASPLIKQEDVSRAESIVKKMTLEEKCRMISLQQAGFYTYGIERLGVKSVLFADATMGVRNLGKTHTASTSFPAGIAMAATFHRQIAREAGINVAEDCKARGVGVLLGPGVNLYRNALCGRNFEYMGEDPYLAGELAADYIQGMQGRGVIATIKHFALNNQEYDRHLTDSKADERTMHELYFPAFRKAIQKGGVAALMTAYNRINGTHASENRELLQLIRDWGFNGIIMSDWSSTYSTVRCANSELDIECPGNQCFTVERLMPYIDRGIITEAQIDRKCIHILSTLSAFGLLDKDIKDTTISMDRDESAAASLETAREAVVLLKNDGVLPFKASKKKTIIVTGPNSDRYVLGGGSSMVFPVPGRVITLSEAMRSLKGYNVICKQSPSIEEMKNAAAVVACVGYDYETEKESEDRPFYIREKKRRSLDYECLNAVSQYASKFVIVLNSGGEVDLSPWEDKASAILLAWYPGQAGGQALAEILTGKISPSGRMPFTWWGSQQANPTYNYYKNMQISKRPIAKEKNTLVEYGEGVFLGYRGIDKFGTPARYPFGYGLTYSKFEYSQPVAEACPEGIKVTFTVKNTGSCAASDVAQLYVAPLNPSVPRPTRELKGFEKIRLNKGESREVMVLLPMDSFSHYDMDIHNWKTDKGSYKIQLCSDAATVLTETEIKL